MNPMNEISQGWRIFMLGILAVKYQISNPKSEISNLKSQHLGNWEFDIWNLGFGIWDLFLRPVTAKDLNRRTGQVHVIVGLGPVQPQVPARKVGEQPALGASGE